MNNSTQTKTHKSLFNIEKVTTIYESLSKTIAFKVLIVSTMFIGGALALGGIFRLLAWTMGGWNQFAKASR